jgi:hypothetical protein
MKGGDHLSTAFITTKTIQTVSSSSEMVVEGLWDGHSCVNQSCVLPDPSAVLPC